MKIEPSLDRILSFSMLWRFMIIRRVEMEWVKLERKLNLGGFIHKRHGKVPKINLLRLLGDVRLRRGLVVSLQFLFCIDPTMECYNNKRIGNFKLNVHKCLI